MGRLSGVISSHNLCSSAQQPGAHELHVFMFRLYVWQQPLE